MWRKVTLDELLICAASFRQALPSVPIETSIKFGLSLKVLGYFLGDNWVKEYIMPADKQWTPHNRRKGRQFFGNEYRYQEKVLSLAEHIFNMQHIEGIDKRLKLLQTDDVEAALGELQCAALLASPELKFKFYPGKNEGEITYQGTKIFCEAKTKRETTSLGVKTLYNSLEEARIRQLPKGQPGLILIRLPEEWEADTKESQDVIKEAVDKVHRQSKRIIASIFISDKWTTINEGKRIEYKSYCFPNIYNESFGIITKQLLEKIGKAKNFSWISFHQLASHIASQKTLCLV